MIFDTNYVQSSKWTSRKGKGTKVVFHIYKSFLVFWRNLKEKRKVSTE